MYISLYTCVLQFILSTLLLMTYIHVYLYAMHVGLFVLSSIKLFECVKLQSVIFTVFSCYDIFKYCNMESRRVYFIQSL